MVTMAQSAANWRNTHTHNALMAVGGGWGGGGLDFCVRSTSMPGVWVGWGVDKKNTVRRKRSSVVLLALSLTMDGRTAVLNTTGREALLSP